MKAGDIIQGTISKCCGTSVSPINGHNDSSGKYVPHHYKCNNCGKATEAIKKDMWILTDKLKYKAL